MKEAVEESGAQTTFETPPWTVGRRCWPVSAPRGVGLGDGEGDGEGDGGGWVTNVIVFGALSSWPDAVLAPGPTVTWYWVFGAGPSLVGRAGSVLPSHE